MKTLKTALGCLVTGSVIPKLLTVTELATAEI